MRERYEAEDTAKQDELDASYREGREAKTTQVTPDDERDKALQDAEAHATAAARAVVAFAFEARTALRGCEELPEGYNPHLSADAMRLPGDGTAASVMRAIRDDEQALREQIEEAKRAMDAAGLRLREYQPLKVWLARKGNGGPTQIMPGNALQIPATHTGGSKPRDLPVQGWWPDTKGEGEEVAFDETAEEGYVDQSDPWFKQVDTDTTHPKER